MEIFFFKMEQNFSWFWLLVYLFYCALFFVSILWSLLAPIETYIFDKTIDKLTWIQKPILGDETKVMEYTLGEVSEIQLEEKTKPRRTRSTLTYYLLTLKINQSNDKYILSHFNGNQSAQAQKTITCIRELLYEESTSESDKQETAISH